ncbi:MAG: phosphatase PAP2/dual specificity phosphatase family protein [Gammaproteobacteria bacterium]
MSADAPASRLMGGQHEARPWKRASLYLVLLGSFFFASYGFANWLASQRVGVPSLVYEWEHAIPFVPWTIVPYWSIDAFYALSLFVCANRKELDTHALRLLSAQLISVTFFIAFPLTFSFDRPAVDGVFGRMFDVLAGFDKPFNQAPSLHISLLVVLWSLYAKRVGGAASWLLHAWFLLIGLSVLTTYQHHFIDVPTGALAGLLCLWLWPDQGTSPFAAASWTADTRRRTLALRYGFAALALSMFSLWQGGAGLWLLWGALALALVALNYGLFGASGFQKQGGRHSLASRVMLAPYLFAVRINARVWTRRAPAPSLIAEGVWLGRLPSRRDWADRPFGAVVDVTCEMGFDAAGAEALQYRCVPLLDLTIPDADFLREVVDAIERVRGQGALLVCCALGYSRSATAVAAWLLHTRRANSVAQAIEQIRRARPGIVLTEAHRAALQKFVAVHGAAAHA